MASLVFLSVFITIFGIRIFNAVARYTAQPLSQLVQRASALDHGSPAEGTDEITRLSHVFEELVAQQATLSAAMESHTELESAQYLLYRLGVFAPRDFSFAVTEKLDRDLDQWLICGLRVLVYRFDDTIHFVENYPPREQWAIKSALRQEFSALCQAQHGFGLAADLPNGQGVTAVAAFPPNQNSEQLLDEIREALSRNCGLSLSCSISDIIHQVSELPTAFHEANHNCRYRLFYANSTITPNFVSSIRSQRTNLSYAGAEEILQAVKACSYPDISRGINHFFADITQRATLSSYKLAYFDILSRLNKLVSECPRAEQTRLINMLDVLYEKCYEDISHLQNDLYQFCTALADTTFAHRSSQLSGDLLSKIYSYVDSNYASPLLSLSSIAENLAFSPSYLTRYFKEKTGVSLMQYIDRRRFEESKHLLAATNLPIKAIVERVGYTDEANFSRKFKKHEGITPTQYRTMQKQKKP